VGSVTTTTQYRAAASSALAPGVTSTVSCWQGKSVGLAAVAGGISIGSGNVDETCETQEVSKTMAQLGDPHSARENLCHIEKVRKTREVLGTPCAPGFYPVKAAPRVGSTNAYGELVQ
jgi:hypothetical protein